MKPDYWIIVDHLDSGDQHDYTFLFHLAPDVVVERLAGPSALLRAASNGALLIIEALTDQELGSEVIEGSESPIQGWFSEDHYKKCSSPVLSFDVDGARSVFVAWVLYPLPAGSDGKEVSASMEHETDTGCTAIRVQSDGHADCVRLPDCTKANGEEESARLSKFSLERKTRL